MRAYQRGGTASPPPCPPVCTHTRACKNCIVRMKVLKNIRKYSQTYAYRHNWPPRPTSHVHTAQDIKHLHMCKQYSQKESLTGRNHTSIVECLSAEINIHTYAQPKTKTHVCGHVRMLYKTDETKNQADRSPDTSNLCECECVWACVCVCVCVNANE